MTFDKDNIEASCKWDLSEIDCWTGETFPRGAVIPDAGNSRDYVVGGWRSERPIRDVNTCTECLLCWIVCPDSAISADSATEKLCADTFNYNHCKGCGICAEECPVDAITMMSESECKLGGE